MLRHFTGHPRSIAALAITLALGHAPLAEAGRPSKDTATPIAATLALSADRYSIPAGDTATLTWVSENVSRCKASGSWSGRQANSGSFRTTQLLTQSRFTLTCDSGTGPVERSVLIDVVQPSGAPSTSSNTGTSTTSTPIVTPTLKLASSASAIRTGENVTLSWSGESVSNCQASGSWSGARSTIGSEIRAQLVASENYTLTCDSASGKIMAMTSVQVWSGGTQISWVPPQQNVDGTPLTDLSAFRIYVGTISQSYHEQIEVSDVSSTQRFLDLLPGEYYIAMSAVDTEGNESALSNEVRKIVQ